ncbi:MAG: DUF763 domain-containing protein [Candidatus Nealsonbacteria bacterium]|nr:DUF763 domain-containing protein [Candidatus Nealsonbacteria bacterium]
MKKGVATFGLDTGKCPRWLFSRMKKLGSEIIEIVVQEYGPDEFVKRIADPVWFQSLGTVLAFDWNASGLTTVLTAALKEAIRDREESLGLFICGGKGKTSRKTPQEIKNWGEASSLSCSHVGNLVYNSKMTAKVDSALVQDGFQIYHHCFLFSRNGSWAVIQQGMNSENRTARRYHWHSEKVTDLVCEPHTGIATQSISSTLNLTSKQSKENQKVSTKLVRGSYGNLMKDIKILRKHSSDLSQMVALKHKERQLTLLHLESKEFSWHPVLFENFSQSKYLDKILWKTCQRRPENYENLLSLQGVGPKTIRALSLVSEVIYGAEPSYEDPARYSFAHGGKDGTPFFVDKQAYDQSIEFFKKVVKKMKLPLSEKRKIVFKLDNKHAKSTSS